MSEPRAAPIIGMQTTMGVGGAVAETERLHPGEQIGRYVVLEELGEGGMAVVYGAYDPELDRKVALKLVKSEALEDDGSDGRKRLLREAKALAKLSHPNVVPVHDAGTDRGRVFLAMEFVDGVTLRRWIDGESRTVEEILETYIAAGQGLIAAHDAGLVHRDFKPENVMLGNDGRVRVMDFGLAHRQVAARPEGVGDLSELSVEDDSAARQMVGTLAYMSPEQFSQLPVGPAADQFAMCVSLWEALYGTRPFSGGSPALLGLAVIRGEVEDPPPKSNVPPRIEQALRRGLSVEPEQRWPTLRELLDALRPPAPSRARPWLIAALATTVAAGALVWSPDDDPCRDAGAEMDATWSDDQRTRVRAAFEATGLPLAETTLPRVESALDGYAGRWRSARQELCRTEDHELSGAWLACLQSRRTEFAGVVSTLAIVDGTGVPRAIETVQRLGEVERCADPTYLNSALPIPGDEKTARRVREVREALSRAEALGWSGEEEEALASAREVERMAFELGYLPAHAEALVVLASAHPSRSPQSAAAAQRAWVLALESGHDSTALSAATMLVRSHAGSPELYAQWSANARAFLARSKPGPRAEARLLRAEALALGVLHREDDAQRKLDEALQLLEGFEPDFQVVDAWNDKARLARLQGRFDDALRNAQKSRTLARQVFGDDHPIQIMVDRVMGSILFELGRHDEALKYLGDAVARAKAAFGPDHPQVALVLAAVANTLMQSGQTEAALQHHERTYEAFSRALGPDAPPTVMAASNWGVALDLIGRPHEAIEKHQIALAALEKQPVPDPVELARNLDNLGSAMQGTGAYDRAEPMHRRAVGLWEEMKGPDHPSLAISLRDHARALIGLGRLEEAITQLRRSAEIFEAAQIDPLEAATTRMFLAHALQEMGQAGDEADRVRERALIAFEAAGEIGKRRLEALQEWGRVKSPDEVAPAPSPEP